jgi:hypothetical protein
MPRNELTVALGREIGEDLLMELGEDEAFLCDIDDVVASLDAIDNAMLAATNAAEEQVELAAAALRSARTHLQGQRRRGEKVHARTAELRSAIATRKLQIHTDEVHAGELLKRLGFEHLHPELQSRVFEQARQLIAARTEQPPSAVVTA